MKNLFLSLFVFMFLVSCKESKNLVSKQDCIGLEEYNELKTVDEKAEWLRNNGKSVCENILNEGIKNSHTVKISDITSTNNNSSYTIKWKDIEPLIGNYFYDRYVTFDIVNDKIRGLKLISKFRADIPCYSIPFIKYLNKEHSLNPESEIEFKLAEIFKSEKVIILVKDTSNTIFIYDYSDEPKSLKGKSYPL